MMQTEHKWVDSSVFQKEWRNEKAGSKKLLERTEEPNNWITEPKIGIMALIALQNSAESLS